MSTDKDLLRDPPPDVPAPEASAHPPLDEDAAAFADEAAELAAAAELQAELEAERAALEAAAAEELPPEAPLAGEEDPPADELARTLSEDALTPDEQALQQADAPGAELDGVAPADIAEVEADEEARAAAEKLAQKARRLTPEQIRHVLHALLFVSDRALTEEQLKAATGIEPKKIRKALEKLAGELREGVSGVVLSEVGGAWQLRTAPEAADFVRRFLQVKPRRLTRAALETLAIVAYRQPVTRPEIEDIRGVDCGAVLKALLDWKLVKILGKKDEVGRPLLYGTTREFLEFFQLKDLGSLPSLREFHELSEESRQIVEEELGPEAVAGIAGTVAELSDPEWMQKEQARVAESEAALADLEQAMATAEEKAGAVAAAIKAPDAPPAPEAE